MDLVRLGEKPELIELLADWHYAEWRLLYPQESREDFRDQLAASAESSGQLPMTWLAVNNGQLLGSVSLLKEDLDHAEEPGPWLANVFVHAGHRGRGIGRWLVEQAMQQAQALSVKCLYLFTEDQQLFYERLGWRAVRLQSQGDATVSIMCWEVAA
ncbi:GNAT family N-acetyltransferase [Atopomonas hussainii]|uniref:GNAT family N-acetyltransferase n=1 Tax=Atopomonas hussainii TaxID=1429083 RepID=UPI0009000E78